MMRISISSPLGRRPRAGRARVDTTGLLAAAGGRAGERRDRPGARAAMGLSLPARLGPGEARRGSCSATALMDAGRGRGSTLTPLADKLIWADRRIAARLSPLLESLASELEHELDRILPPPAPRRVAASHASHGFAVARTGRAAGRRAAAGRTALPQQLRVGGGAGARRMRPGGLPRADRRVRAARTHAATARWLRTDTHCLVHVAVRTQGLFVARGQPQAHARPGRPETPRPALRQPPRGLGHAHADRADAGQARDRAERGARLRRAPSSRMPPWQPSSPAAWPTWAWACRPRRSASACTSCRCCASATSSRCPPLLREPTVRRMLELMQSPKYRSSVAALIGYEAGETGRVMSVEEALPDN